MPMRSLCCLSIVGCLAILASADYAAAAQAGQDGPLELKLVANKDRYAWDGGGMMPADFRKLLDQLAADQKDKKGFGAKVPAAPVVDLVLRITNTSKDDVTTYTGGTANVYTFDLKGPGVVTLRNNAPMPAIIILPRATTLKPGASIDIPVAKLMDGRRGMARLLYWTEPGEYTLSVSYQLSDAKGAPAQLLKSAAVKIVVDMPK
jgi:hypothetical protein